MGCWDLRADILMRKCPDGNKKVISHERHCEIWGWQDRGLSFANQIGAVLPESHPAGMWF